MSQKITTETLMVIAGTIEKLLLEEQEGIAFSYDSVPDLKITIGINLDPTSDGVEANYSLAYALEAKREAIPKRLIRKKEVINSQQQGLFEGKHYQLGAE